MAEGIADESKVGRKLSVKSFSFLVKIVQYLKPYRLYFVLGLISLVLSSIPILIFPRLAGELLDIATGKGKYFNNLNTAALFLLFILLLQSIFSYVRVYSFSIVSERSVRDLRRDLYQKIIWLSMTFFDKNRVGDLISRVTADVSTLYDTFSFTFAELLRQTITLVVGIVIISLLAPSLTRFMLLTIPIMVILALAFGRFIRKLSKQTQDALAKTNVIVEETFQTVSMVKAFTNERFELMRYVNALNAVVNISIRGSRYRALFIAFVILVLFGGMVSVGWYGATLVQENALTTGELFSFILYTSFIGFSIAGLGDIYSQIQRSAGASERILELLQETDERTDNEMTIRLNGPILFDRVSFSYPTRPGFLVLKDFTADIQEGEKIALVGQSGSGKSTIVNLLMRFYEVDSGAIYIGGKSLATYDLRALRGNFGIVPQEVILFGGTIRENIEYGRPGASDSEIREAAQSANALEFIDRFPDGLDTVVGERGVKLSGGQRQRIAIARAILRDPAILILDEATSSLDAQAEVLVQQALEQLMQGRTTIIIAHRLSTIKKADRIFVIHEGTLAEIGSHDQLKELKEGIYNNLLRLQLQ